MRTLALLAFVVTASQALAQGSPASANKTAPAQQPTGTKAAPAQPTQTKAAAPQAGQTKSASTKAGETKAAPNQAGQTKSTPTAGAQTKSAVTQTQTKGAPAAGAQTKTAPSAGAQTKTSAQGTQTKTGAAPRNALTVAPEAAPQTRVPVIMREVFEYDNGGRRDPFISLLTTSDLRPTVADLRLVGVLYDESGRRPVAVMRDIATNTQYRVTTGMTLGRMRVSAIKRRSVVFTIEEFGLNRTDSLWLGDTTKVRAR
ncbi:MAG TPA: hypothetical protein VFT29_02645 [Gemmatimonadaceae bacterium]|nr:hypothetical protein [Gemmatimonadaceae bacterium]